MKNEIQIKRSEAAAIIEGIRVLLAQRTPPERIEEWLAGKNCGLPTHKIPPLRPCLGEAHSNLHIDNCSTCAPRWGLVGPTVRVR